MGRIRSRYEQFKRWLSPQERELWRLVHLPPHQATTTELLGPALQVVDGPSFYWTYKGIIERESYNFSTDDPQPLILDCGANVGLSVIFFKRRFPQARIVAFEPDPAVFAALEHNVSKMVGTENVELVMAAVWSSQNASLPFFAEGSNAGRLGERPQNAPTIKVPSVRLRDYLDQPVSMLKLDIEGAELEVLQDCADKLGQVSYLFVEYHSFHGKQQRLDEVLAILRKAGFRIHLENDQVLASPFIDRTDILGMDLLVNVFAYRTEGESSYLPSPVKS